MKRLRIKVARTREGDQTTAQYRVVTKLLDKRRFEEILTDFLSSRGPRSRLGF